MGAEKAREEEGQEEVAPGEELMKGKSNKVPNGDVPVWRRVSLLIYLTSLPSSCSNVALRLYVLRTTLLDDTLSAIAPHRAHHDDHNITILPSGNRASMHGK
jgi:hypothetical protein